MTKRLIPIAFALVAGLARADLNIDVNTPPTVILKHSMEQRSSRLERFYNAGVIGLANNGEVALRDASRLTLMQRQIAEKLIDAENNDRKGLLYSVVEANHKNDAVPEVQAALVKRWREHWKSGWYMQDDQGAWSKKP